MKLAPKHRFDFRFENETRRFENQTEEEKWWNEGRKMTIRYGGSTLYYKNWKWVEGKDDTSYPQFMSMSSEDMILNLLAPLDPSWRLRGFSPLGPKALLIR